MVRNLSPVRIHVEQLGLHYSTVQQLLPSQISRYFCLDYFLS